MRRIRYVEWKASKDLIISGLQSSGNNTDIPSGGLAMCKGFRQNKSFVDLINRYKRLFINHLKSKQLVVCASDKQSILAGTAFALLKALPSDEGFEKDADQGWLALNKSDLIVEANVELWTQAAASVGDLIFQTPKTVPMLLV